MSNMRWCTTNHTLGKTVKNGTGGGAPDRSETAPFVMEKALEKTRINPHVTGATPASPFDADTDLLSALSIQVVGVHGYLPLTAVVTTVQVYSSTTYLGTQTLQATLTVGASAPRDFGTVLASPVSARYWRHRWIFTGGGTVGKFKVGKYVLGPLVDLGKGPSANGYTKDPQRYQVDGGRAGGGNPIRHDLGRKFRIYEIPLNVLTDAEMVKVEALSDVPDTFTLIDSEDVFSEVQLEDGHVRQGRPFHTYWAGGLRLETLG